jgi:DNA-binding MarR family transcriptional regulator
VLVGIAVHSVNVAPVDVTVTQHRILVLLSGHGVLKINELADLLGVNQSNASRHCANLENSGLVTRRRSEADARAVEVRLTATGAEVLESVDNARRREISEVLAKLPAETLEAAVATFAQFNRAAAEIAIAKGAPR